MHLTQLKDDPCWSAECADYESVLMGVDPTIGYVGLVAIHNTRLGPGLGGTRFWTYPSLTDAIVDVLRLSRGMTYKNALAGLPAGGGKAVLMAPDKNSSSNRQALFEAHGRLIEAAKGRYLTAEDVGTTMADMETIHRATQYVTGLSDRRGDPSPYTGRGVFRSLQAAAQSLWKSSDLSGRTVAIQGCGNVASHLARELARSGARLIVADIDQGRARRLADEVGATIVAPDVILRTPADILAPCALGAVFNDVAIPELQVELIVGGANNQLAEPRHADAIAARGILYVPDFLANAGGVINVGAEAFDFSDEWVRSGVERIYDTTLHVLDIAAATGVTPAVAAERLAEARFAGSPA